MEQRPVGVDRGRSLPREQLEREQRGAAGSWTLVLEPSPQQLELLPVAELADRPVGNRTLTEVGAACGAFELVVPAGPQRRELTLGAGRGQLVGFGGR